MDHLQYHLGFFFYICIKSKGCQKMIHYTMNGVAETNIQYQQ